MLGVECGTRASLVVSATLLFRLFGVVVVVFVVFVVVTHALLLNCSCACRLLCAFSRRHKTRSVGVESVSRFLAIKGRNLAKSAVALSNTQHH